MDKAVRWKGKGQQGLVIKRLDSKVCSSDTGLPHEDISMTTEDM